MKKIFTFLAFACLCAAFANARPVTITVKNTSANDREKEMVEVPMKQITAKLGEGKPFIVTDASGNPVAYQVTHDGKLIFQATVGAKQKAVYTVKEGQPAKFDSKVFGRQFPERMDDLAWENDLVSYRAYGPALQKTGERGFGYDIFTKRGTDKPVLELLYVKETNQKFRSYVYKTYKDDKKKRSHLLDSISYHVDHGYGMDCYAVGPTLSCGTNALMEGTTIFYPYCYRTYRILDNGPLRYTMEMEFNPETVAGVSNVIEKRVITLDAGSRYNKAVITYQNMTKPVSFVAGLALHDTTGATAKEASKGYITYEDPTTNPKGNNGKIFVGVVFPGKTMKEARTAMYTEAERKQHGNAYGHILAVGDYKPGQSFTYYFGNAWTKNGMPDAAAWNAYTEKFAQNVNTPLKVSVK